MLQAGFGQGFASGYSLGFILARVRFQERGQQVSRDFLEESVCSAVVPRGAAQWVAELVGRGDHQEAVFNEVVKGALVSLLQRCGFVVVAGRHHRVQVPLGSFKLGVHAATSILLTRGSRERKKGARYSRITTSWA